MKINKLFLKFGYCFAGLLLLISAGLNIQQYYQIKKLTAKISQDKLTKIEVATASDQSNNKSFANKKDGENKKGNFKTIEINELEYHLNASEEELDMAHEALSDELLKKAEYKKAMEENAKNILTNPTFNKNKKEIITLNINNNYGALFQKLDISENELNELKGMLVGQMMDTRKNYEDRIKALLGEKNSEIYQSYVFRLPDRINFNEFIGTLPPDNKINEEQAENIIDSMYGARKAVYSEIFSMNSTDSTSESKDKSLTRMIEKNVRINEKYIEVCNVLLSTDQMQQFKAFLERKQATEISSLKMNNYLYGTN